MLWLVKTSISQLFDSRRVAEKSPTNQVTSEINKGQLLKAQHWIPVRKYGFRLLKECDLDQFTKFKKLESATDLGTFTEAVWKLPFNRVICTVISTSTAWKASKCTGQYECRPRRALGGILNSWTAVEHASREVCKPDLQIIHWNRENGLI